MEIMCSARPGDACRGAEAGRCGGFAAQGLMQVLKGVLDGLKGKEVDMTVPGTGASSSCGAGSRIFSVVDTVTLNSDTAQSLLLMWKKTITRRRSSILRPIWNPSVILL